MSLSLSETVKRRALEAGFELAGVAPADVWRDLEFSRQWVEAGYGGEMAYLANPKRYNPRLLLPSVQSVVCAGLIYNAPLPYSTGVQPECGATVPKPRGGQSRAWISRYAWGTDYHEVMRSKLDQLRKEIEALAPRVATRVYVDTGPVVERAFARYSGMGWTGKNTCLINESKGSWFFLGVILTNLMIQPDLPAFDRCGSCTRCLEACPTGALVEPYVMDASRCVAYLTIELKGSIPEPLRTGVGSNVFGCDICQDVCPWNSPHPTARESGSDWRRGAAVTRAPEFLPREVDIPSNMGAEPADCERETFGSFLAARDGGATSATAPESANRLRPDTWNRIPSPARFSLFNPPLRALALLSEQDFRGAFFRSPVKRAKYRGWLRNLCVAMGNSADRNFIPWLERASEHADPVVREHARWALGRLQGAASPVDG